MGNVHIGRMTRSQQHQHPKTALLSAANIGSDGAGGSMALVGGLPLLAHQIAALHSVGVSRFLIEVDAIPGELLVLADRYRALGHGVDFVRTATDLQDALGMTEPLVVQAEALYLSPELLQAFWDEKTPYLLTVDGRDENAAFERMDLNTRWAGWAILGASTVASLGPLPDGWSVTSSLLRQAMQDRVSMVPLSQQNIQRGDARLMTTATDAQALSRQILAGRAQRFSGFVESRIFASIAALIAPSIWRASSGQVLVDGATIVAAGGSLAFGLTGWPVSALSLAILAIFLNCMRATLGGTEQQRGLRRWVQPFSWLLLAAAAISAGYDDFSYSSDGAYAAINMVGLLLLSQQLNLPTWAQYALKSPALVAIAAIAATPLLGFAQAAQWISLGQLAALVVAKWAHGSGTKKPNQA